VRNENAIAGIPIAIRDSRIASFASVERSLPALVRACPTWRAATVAGWRHSPHAGDRVATRSRSSDWDPKVPFDQFDARSVSNARNASESQVYRDHFLASIKDRLDTAAVKGQALDLCQELFLADGARSDEKDAVLQNLRELFE
jgi:hypothetical protein